MLCSLITHLVRSLNPMLGDDYPTSSILQNYHDNMQRYSSVGKKKQPYSSVITFLRGLNMLEYFAAYVLPSRPHIPLIHILRINDEIKLVAIEGHLGSLN